MTYLINKTLKYVNITLLLTLFLLLFISCRKDNSNFGDIENPTESGGEGSSENGGEGGNTEDTPTHIHELVLLHGKVATCTEEGLLECYKCTGCGLFYLDANAQIHIQGQTVFPRENHTLTYHAGITADCFSGGYDEYYSCDSCHKLFLDENATSEIAEPPYTERLAHTLTAIPELPATCLTVGYREYFKCVRCGKMFNESTADTEISEPIVIETVGHRLAKHNPITPTCTQNGCSEYYSCIYCNSLFGDAEATVTLSEPPVLDMLEHNLTEYPEIKATCTQNGYSAYFVCDVCDGMFLDRNATRPTTSPTLIGSLPHTPTFINAKPSTCTEEGTGEYYRCSECQGIFADEGCTRELERPQNIPVLPHNTVYHAPKGSTCTAKGNIEYYLCTTCEQVFSDSACTVKITYSVELPLLAHVFQGDECINCGHKIEIISYDDFIIASIGDTVSVYGFVTAVNYSDGCLYIQNENYAYRLINASTDGISVGDAIIAVGLKAHDTTVDCSYVSAVTPSNGELPPAPYNATELFTNNTEDILDINQYVFVEFDTITLLYSLDGEYVMGYLDLGESGTRLIRFTLDSAPITDTDKALINESFKPMRQVTVKGLICQDGAELSIIPISRDFFTNLADPVEVPPEAKLRYESLVYPFPFDSLSEDCLIELSCTPLLYDDVRIEWISQSDNISISTDTDSGYCSATVKIDKNERALLIAKFSIDYGEDEPLCLFVTYYINLTK